MKLLHIDTSILGGGSVSRELSALVVKRLVGSGDADVTYRDLTAENVPHLTLASLPSAHPASKAAGSLDAAAQAMRDESDRMLEEFMAADTVVLGVPMYNFTIPTQLKAWIDRIVIPGKTFRYGANGPEGLATGKRVVIAIARGGFYGAETAAVSAEHAESLMRTVMGFIGITDPQFILAEGLAAGEANKTKALASARDAVEQLAA